MESIEFENFKNSCLKDFSELQDEFRELYDLDKYNEWFYNHDLGVFTFKSKSQNLYFKYIDIGSYSKNTKTWKWSWDNEYTPERAKRGIEKVKSFGESNNFSQLTTGVLECDEYTGWEMTALSGKLLNSIGSYKTPVDHLEIYFVFIKELTQDEFDELNEKYVECGNHGLRRRAFICQHLNKRNPTGFHEAFSSGLDKLEEDDDPQGWCDACENARLQEGEWNDNSMEFANIKLVCDKCYFEIKQRNLE